MGIMDVAEGKPEQCTSEQGSAFEVKDNLFRGCILGVIAPHLINPLLKKKTGKEMWDALDAQYGVSDAGSELYLMEQFLDYRMVEDRPVVEQANELHVLAKDLGCCNKENPCVLPDKFVAGGIISKLPPSWRDFATSLKHRRQEFTIDGLIGTLDVEEKARAKDVRNKGTPVGASANFVQKNINARTNNKGKGKKPPQPQNPGKTKQTAGFKKKKGACYVCGSEDHFAGKCPQRKEGKAGASDTIASLRSCSGYRGNQVSGSVSTRLLAQNCYVFTGVRFTVLGTPPPSNDYTAPRLLPARLRRSDCTASTDLPASNLYDYFEQGQSRNIMSTDDIPPAGNGATNAFGRGRKPPANRAVERAVHWSNCPVVVFRPSLLRQKVHGTMTFALEHNCPDDQREGEIDLVVLPLVAIVAIAVVAGRDDDTEGRFPAVFDASGDGQISRSELTELFEILGHAASNNELAGMMAEVDNDCFISLYEFAALNAPPPSSLASSRARRVRLRRALPPSTSLAFWPSASSSPTTPTAGTRIRPDVVCLSSSFPSPDSGSAWGCRPPRPQTFGGRVNPRKLTRTVHPPLPGCPSPRPGSTPRSSAPPIALASVEGRTQGKEGRRAHLRPDRVAAPDLPSMI
ncbi:hypothetical protein HU200_048262 [Digitaria exilis]|uniref:Uncharacterized protein n=1 Tax=Digitaria exilis TaxID=1010633 RepID=A0A835AT58_9POAL|nr:hypothetical protein HU200_048262 [Digitaria exilis]